MAIVYIVDDDEDVRDSLRLLLEMRGYGVDAFCDGPELSRRGDLAACDCMILDVNLPGESGLDILERLRLASVRLPVIVTSGQGTPAIRTKAARLDAAAFLDKPIEGGRLLAMIELAVSPEGKERAEGVK